MNNLIVITGQTATGKTALALKYAKKYNGELVNFDSRQIYKYLDIITGKDISNIKNQGTTIWLYDVIKPDQYFSSFEYIKIAQKVIKDIEKRGKTPILVGGSYFYLKHLLYGFDFPAPPNFKLREKLNKKSVEELQKILLDLQGQNLQGQNLIGSVLKRSVPKMNNSDWYNPRRLIRKIEILQHIKMGGEISEFKITPRSVDIHQHSITNEKKLDNAPILIGLRYKNKEKLYQAIVSRVEKRVKQGAVEEVKKLLEMGYKKTDPGLNTIGYKQLIEFLEGKVKKEKSFENWINAEMQYAKRQYTFMKKDKNIKWKIIS